MIEEKFYATSELKNYKTKIKFRRLKKRMYSKNMLELSISSFITKIYFFFGDTIQQIFLKDWAVK